MTLEEVDHARRRLETPSAAGAPLPPRGAMAQVAARYLSLALADNVLSPQEEAAWEALNTLPNGLADTPASNALERFMAHAQRSGGGLSVEEAHFIESLIDTLESNPEGDVAGFKELLDLLNDFVSKGTVPRELSKAEFTTMNLLLKLVRSGQHNGPALTALLSLVRRFGMEGAHLFNGLYSGFTDADGVATGERAPTPGSSGGDAIGGAEGAEGTAGTTTNPKLAAALREAAAALRQGAALLESLAGTDPDLGTAEAVMARIAQARAGLQPFVAQGDPDAIAADKALATLHTSLGTALHTTKTDTGVDDPRTVLARRLGDAVPAGWVAALSIDQVLALLKLDPVVMVALVTAGMKAADVLQLAPTVSRAEVGLASFIDTLTTRLDKGDTGADAVLWARYSGVATDVELSNQPFRIDLGTARDASPTGSPQSHVDRARVQTLFRQLDGTVTLDTLLLETSEVISSLLREDPSLLQTLIAAGVSLPAIATATDEQMADLHAAHLQVVTALLEAGMNLSDVAQLASTVTLKEAANKAFMALVKAKLSDGLSAGDALIWARNHGTDNANHEIIQALVNAGMSPTDATRLASSVDLEEVRTPGFIAILSKKLNEGTSADDAIVWARYSGVATDAELSDPAFLKDLSQAAAQGHGASEADAVNHARAQAVVRHTGGAIKLETALKLTDVQRTRLLSVNSTVIKKFLEMALSLDQFFGLSAPQLASLLAANPQVLSALLETGMSLPDVIATAGKVTFEEAVDPAFVATLQRKLGDGLSAADAVVWARYSGFATFKELANEAFRKDLAENHGDFTDKAEAVRDARARRLVRRLQHAIDLPTAKALDPVTLQALLAEKPENVREFLALGLSLTQYVQSTAQQRAALLDANPVIVKALLGAGMPLDHVVLFASLVSIEEATTLAFMDKLKEKLTAGLSSDDAVLWARFSGLATDAELSDPQFRFDLDHAPEEGCATKDDALRYARALLLARRLVLDPGTVLHLSLTELTALVNIDPGQITALMGRGLNLQQISQTNYDQRVTLLGGDSNYDSIVRALLGTGMNVLDVVAYAGTVVLAPEVSADFIAKVQQAIAGGASGGGAIASARYGDQLSAEELANKDFVHNLLFASNYWDQPRRGQSASELISALGDLREQVDIFDASEKIAYGSSAHEDWFHDRMFNGVAINQLDSMSVDSAEWAQIEVTLGRGLSTDERHAAIHTARIIKKHWDFLSGNFVEMNLFRTKDDNAKEFIFTAHKLHFANMSPVIATIDNTQSNLLSALDYVRNHIDFFDSAEEYVDGSQRDHDGKFVNIGVFKIATMGVDDIGWQRIERYVGRGPISREERQRAINAAKCLTENWETLYARAAELGLSPDGNRKIDGRNVIFFKSDMLASLKWDLLLPAWSTAVAHDRTHSLKYARSLQLEKNFATNGLRTDGLGRDNFLNLSLEQVNRLLAMKPDAVKMLLAQNRPLAEIADLSLDSVNSLVNITESHPDLLPWLLQLASYTLAEIAKLSNTELAALKIAKDKNYREATASEDFNNVKVDTITAIDLGAGMLIFQTDSGQQIRVTKETNFKLYNKVHALLETRVADKINAVRSQFGLLPTSEVDVMALQSNTLQNPDKPSDGYMSVGQLIIDKLMDKYRGLLERGEIGHDDPRAKLMRAFEARSALAHGNSLLPYYEAPGSFGSTHRVHPGGNDDPDFSLMSSADMEALIDPMKVEAKISELLGNTTIQSDYQAAVDASVAGLTHKDALRDSLYTTLAGPAYIDALQALKDKGLVYEAEQMTRNDLQALAMLSPAKSAEAAQQLTISSLGRDFQNLLDDPTLVDNIHFDQATTDSISITIDALRSGTAILRHSTQTTADLIKYLEETLGNKRLVTEIAGTLKQLVIEAKTLGKNLGEVGQVEFDRAMAKTYVPLDLRAGVSGFFGTMQKFGVWGSLGGGAAMAAFGYKVAHGAFGADSTAMDRYGAASDIITFLSVTNHTVKSSTALMDSLLKMVGKNPQGEAAWKALGLDLSLPNLWGKTSFLPYGLSYGDMWTIFKPSTTKPAPNALELAAAENLEKRFNAELDKKIFTVKPELVALPGGVTKRIVMSALRTIGTVTDLAGIADIVIGAMGLHQSRLEGDVGGIVVNSFAVVGGVALTGAGMIGTASLFASVGPVLTAAGAPLFLVGAVFAAAGFIVTAILDSIKKQKRLLKAARGQTQWFKDLSNDGLAVSNWDKTINQLEYLRYAWSIYGPNRSYFDFQSAEWEHFRQTPSHKGSSLNRLDSSLHVHTELTTPDPRDNEAEYSTY